MSEWSSDLEDEKSPSGTLRNGNKRTALIVAENILGQEGLFLAAGEDQVVKFMLGVASYQYGSEEIEKWIQNTAEKME